MNNDVTDLISALRDGSLTLEEVARRFRERDWPPTKRPPPTSYVEMAAREEQDPEPGVPGSFDDVVAAYARGELTRDQYQTLGEAVAEAKWTKQRRGQ